MTSPTLIMMCHIFYLSTAQLFKFITLLHTLIQCFSICKTVRTGSHWFALVRIRKSVAPITGSAGECGEIGCHFVAAFL